MRRFALAILLVGAAARARAADWLLSDRLIVGGGRYLGNDLEAGALLPGGRWGLSTRVKSFRYLDAFSGSQIEYSGRAVRHLPHVTIAGRLGTAPPNSQRLGYHLASGEVVLSFYRWQLGPEDLATAATVAEDTTTVSELAALDKNSVLRFRSIYTNTNFHQEATSATGKRFVLVQGSWQFELSQTWNERTTIALQNGHERYSDTIGPASPVFYHWNVDFQGAPVALSGWPNNHLGASVSQRFADWEARAALTRVNMLFGERVLMGGGEVLWRPAGRPYEARAGWYQISTGGAGARSVFSFGASRRW